MILSLVGLGDIHGEFSKIIEKIMRMDLRDMFILQVGDFGMYNELPLLAIKLENFDRILKERNLILYSIRGNHDDPIYFSGNWNDVENAYVYSDEYRYALESIKELTNIHLVPDYTVLELLGKRILCIGGAVSVDRNKLTEGYNWWPGEELKYEQEKLDAIDNIDILCMHIAPDSIFHKFNLNVLKPEFVKLQLKTDKNLSYDLYKELSDAEKILQHINKGQYLELYCGHYHKSLSIVTANISASILDIDEFKIII